MKPTWAQQHREEANAYSLAWSKENSEKFKAIQRASRQKNKEHRSQQSKEYQAELRKDPVKLAEIRAYHREAQRKRRHDPATRKQVLLMNKVHNINRRAGLKTLTKEVIQQVYEENIKRFGTLTCELCLKPIKFGEDTLEHFHPVSRQDEYKGKDVNERKNLGVAHGKSSVERCNTIKNDRTLKEYKQYLKNLKEK